MKRIMMISLMIGLLLLSGCATKTTDDTTEVSVNGNDVVETEKETEAEIEEEQEYYAVDLAQKSLSEIIDIMGGDFAVEYNGEHLIHYTDGGLCIYNDSTLPNFAFFVKAADGYTYEDLADPFYDLEGVKSDVLAGKYDSFWFMGIYNDAKYDENISASMTYVDISLVLGSYELGPIVGSMAMRQNIEYDDKPGATIYYNTPPELENNITNKDGFDYYDTVKARELNPTIQGIAVMSESVG